MVIVRRMFHEVDQEIAYWEKELERYEWGTEDYFTVKDYLQTLYFERAEKEYEKIVEDQRQEVEIERVELTDWIKNIGAWIVLVAAMDFVHATLPAITKIASVIWSVIQYIFTIAKSVYEWATPKINWLLTQIDKINTKITSVYNSTIGYVDTIYTDLFSWYDKLRDTILAVSGKIERITEVIVPELADKIDSEVNKVIESTDKLFRGWRDEIIGKATEMYLAAVNELHKEAGALRELITPLEVIVYETKNLIAPTIEKPNLLAKETMEQSGAKYGGDLFLSYFDAETPELPDEIARGPSTERVMDYFDVILADIAKGKEGVWGDLYTYQEEEIEEATRKKTLPTRTPLTLPPELFELFYIPGP